MHYHAPARARARVRVRKGSALGRAMTAPNAACPLPARARSNNRACSVYLAAAQKRQHCPTATFERTSLRSICAPRGLPAAHPCVMQPSHLRCVRERPRSIQCASKATRACAAHPFPGACGLDAAGLGPACSMLDALLPLGEASRSALGSGQDSAAARAPGTRDSRCERAACLSLAKRSSAWLWVGQRQPRVALWPMSHTLPDQSRAPHSTSLLARLA